MSTTPFLSDPLGRDPIDPATLAYFRQRNKGKAYNTVIDEFEKSGISRADLAARLRKGTDQISRWLGSPGNWTMDTYSDLLFAICGGELTHTVRHPLRLAASNHVAPQWMTLVYLPADNMAINNFAAASQSTAQSNVVGFTRPNWGNTVGNSLGIHEMTQPANGVSVTIVAPNLLPWQETL